MSAQEKAFEVIGVKGLKNISFRKVFKTQKSYEAWLDKNEGSIEIHGMRDLEENEK